MPSLKDLKNRIDSVKSTQKITKAMQMVAAAKLRAEGSILEAIRASNDLSDDVAGKLKAQVEAFAKTFA